ncbi:HAD-IIIA family hydrolase [Flavobacteriaceae bacterium]|jgi:3-deoxy-D-manno-octulosonate 8-phosphate phosphatase (KDO 8-P phosphatase)|nr:HAD-IIIA family hydrolase [Flavobacteriaceae bacterium]MDB4269739.1 HAD-IIIA family hydrolase [Flavobacteriaceae bacterium]MDB4612232.1 HAD-IIIA family hydrolase [Flavobacteriaceae bacterium]MDC3218498.1 HAD-IIIA family hydrolase [Flavobacteriaceae bacterium]MDG1343130.1 HAD-IIIA family hydrolase [Flavobacteriaceae bacterium]|tara:strand:- start:8136 stop:8666 length:531 start_codon:yes stop_codon:yes gene_type:complete
MKMKNYKTLLPNIKTFIFDVDGVLTDGKILITNEGELLRSFDTKDGYAMKCALVQGYKIAIITGGRNQGVEERFKELGVYDIYMGAHHKLDAFQDLLDNYDLDPETILYIGDDVPDIPVMEKVGLGCCPADAVSDVKAMADYVSHKNGGEGCVRELIEQVLRVQGKWRLDIGAGKD